MWDKIKSFVTAHPYVTGLGVFGIGLVIILYYSGRKSVGGNDMSAYYAAAAASTASGNQLAATQIAANAATNQATLASQVALQQTNNQLEAVKSALSSNTDVEKIRADTSTQIADIASKTAQNVSIASVRQNEFQSLVTANTLQQLIGIMRGAGFTVGNLSPTSSFTA